MLVIVMEPSPFRRLTEFCQHLTFGSGVLGLDTVALLPVTLREKNLGPLPSAPTTDSVFARSGYRTCVADE